MNDWGHWHCPESLEGHIVVESDPEMWMKQAHKVRILKGREIRSRAVVRHPEAGRWMKRAGRHRTEADVRRTSWNVQRNECCQDRE